MAAKPSARTPLFVRLPSEQAASLDDAARRLRLTKGLIVAQAISNYLAELGDSAGPDVVDAATRFVNSTSAEPFVPTAAASIEPNVPVGIGALRGAPIGRHEFTSVQELEVLTLDQLAELLSLEVAAVRGLAETGKIPGRKLGEEWRFSRAAVLDWLGGE
jgi:excisionase family DNA binding protein